MAHSEGRAVRFYYGWVIIGVAFFMYWVKAGILMLSVGPLVSALIADMGWTRAQAGGAVMVNSWIGMLAPLGGFAVVRWGPRRVLTLGGFIAFIAFGATAFVTHVWQLYLTYAVGVAVGALLTTHIGIFALVNNWWRARNGMAIGVVGSAAALSGVVFTPGTQYLIQMYGWRHAVLMLAAFGLLVAVIIAYLFIRDEPENIGQVIDNGEQVQQAATRSKLYLSSVDWTVKAALRTPQLWFVIGCVAASSCSGYTFLVFGIDYLRTMGIPPMLAAAAMGTLALFQGLGSLGSGFLVDKLGHRPILILATAFISVGALCLIFAKTMILVWAFSFFFGLGGGSIGAVTTALISAYYGRKNYAAILASAFPLITLVCGLAPMLTGLVYGAYGSYLPAMTAIAACLPITVLLAFFTSPPKTPASASPMGGS